MHPSTLASQTHDQHRSSSASRIQHYSARSWWFGRSPLLRYTTLGVAVALVGCAGELEDRGDEDVQTVASAVTAEHVVLYRDSNFSGASQKLEPGTYNLSALKAGIGNDALSSLRVPTGWTVKLYQDVHFRGASRTITADTKSLGDFNDKTSSVLVIGPATPDLPPRPIRLGLSGNVDAENLRFAVATDKELIKNLVRFADMLGFARCNVEKATYLGLSTEDTILARDFRVSKGSGDSYVIRLGYSGDCDASNDRRMTFTLKNFRFVVDPETFVYDAEQETALTPIVVAETTALNASDTASNVTVSLTDEHTDSLTHTTETSITAGIDVSLSATAKIPFFAEVNQTTTFSLSSTVGWTNTTSSTDVTGVTVAYTAQVPARSRKLIQMLASRTQYDVDYTGLGKVKFDLDIAGIFDAENGQKSHPNSEKRLVLSFGDGSESAFEEILDLYDHAHIPNYSEWDWQWIRSYAHDGDRFRTVIGTFRGGVVVPLQGTFRFVTGIATNFQEGPAVPL
jgi:hypothetical protein